TCGQRESAAPSFSIMIPCHEHELFSCDEASGFVQSACSCLEFACLARVGCHWSGALSLNSENYRQKTRLFASYGRGASSNAERLIACVSRREGSPRWLRLRARRELIRELCAWLVEWGTIEPSCGLRCEHAERRFCECQRDGAQRSELVSRVC